VRPSLSRISTAIAAVAALAAVAVPRAGAEAVPWGYNCTPVSAEAPRTSASCGATLLDDGRAVPPPGAPPAVAATIAAANRIVHKPYVWGGGHLRWWDGRGYDCSGAVGYALHGGGMLATTMVSGQLAYWGEGGLGRWITVYANAEHVYMVVAGLRFDTRGDPPGVSGPRWHAERPYPEKFVARHPAGL
jgi:hypothetical protein